MARTVVEIQADITALERALQELNLGKRVTTLIVGSGPFARRYTHQEISVENIRGQLSRLQDELLQAQSVVAGAPLVPTFRSFGSMRLTLSKGTNSNRGNY